jgi:oligopeptide/dipeptide ABC transporter ATP-binding protein
MQPIGRQIGRVVRAHHGDSGGGRRAQRRRAIDLLRLVGINDPERRAGAFAHELSGGMAQRALIAMALSAKPKLLIADEPTSGLDVTVQAQFLDMMWQTIKETGTAMLLVSQEPGILAHYCDSVAVMRDGRVVSQTSTIAYFAANPAAERQRVRPPLAEGAAVIEVAGLRKTFPLRGSTQRVQAVNDVSFSVQSGEAVGLVGESGSGKTTVGRCILQLEPPSGGSVQLEGRSLIGLAPETLRRRRARMQFVRQDPYDSFDPRWSIARSLAEPLDVHSDLDGAGKARRVHALLSLIGADPQLGAARPRDLDAGTLQRLNIARALATDPPFIVLDEPTSVLAPEARRAVILLLTELQQRLGLAYLFISHDLTTVAALCHRVVVMYLGQVVEIASAERLFRAPAHPYSRALLAAYLAPDPTLRRVDGPRLDQLTGEIPSPIDLPPGCFLASRCSYATPRCSQERQTLTQLPDGSSVRCWRVAEGDLPQQSVEHATL